MIRSLFEETITFPSSPPSPLLHSHETLYKARERRDEPGPHHWHPHHPRHGQQPRPPKYRHRESSPPSPNCLRARENDEHSTKACGKRPKQSGGVFVVIASIVFMRIRQLILGCRFLEPRGGIFLSDSASYRRYQSLHQPSGHPPTKTRMSWRSTPSYRRPQTWSTYSGTRRKGCQSCRISTSSVGFG